MAEMFLANTAQTGHDNQILLHINRLRSICSPQ